METSFELRKIFPHSPKFQSFDPPGGPKHDEMKKKYGPESVKWTRYWIENWGFPPEGSFSMSEIRKL